MFPRDINNIFLNGITIWVKRVENILVDKFPRLAVDIFRVNIHNIFLALSTRLRVEWGASLSSFNSMKYGLQHPSFSYNHSKHQENQIPDTLKELAIYYDNPAEVLEQILIFIEVGLIVNFESRRVESLEVFTEKVMAKL